jgi:hypothetical protein
VYTCAPSDFYDSLGHASTDRVTRKPVCPRWELQPDSPRQRRRLQCWLRPLTVDEMLHGGQAGRQPVLAFLAGLAMTQATRAAQFAAPGASKPWARTSCGWMELWKATPVELPIVSGFRCHLGRILWVAGTADTVSAPVAAPPPSTTVKLTSALTVLIKMEPKSI